ncbi:VOC family protein [Paenibacillus eucommiae]|uniref:Catechol 2,3-dioxygenase-like lactoylglutathione lyase family enzyme n=1 Tax=Paenibacillus eucommiae TaxID=1355755 RepID=A0ABS4J194_9BACL|nr:VOC family protein [Paenibacillus eucommiae]MBP1993568.1 catechol 2,3-dioxygenase-like lactoylglutathione lyase family enzyme [Paenibacillus eucommiae]
MIEYQHLHHVSLSVRDLEKSKKFYTEVLKFQEIERPPFDSKGVWFAVGSQQLHLLEYPNGETLRESSSLDDGHFAIWVKSYRDTIAWLEEAGVPYEAKPDSIAGFSQIFILDVDRNIVEFDSEYGS